jgi:hypothetical protein
VDPTGFPSRLPCLHQHIQRRANLVFGLGMRSVPNRESLRSGPKAHTVYGKDTLPNVPDPAGGPEVQRPRKLQREVSTLHHMFCSVVISDMMHDESTSGRVRQTVTMY